MKFIKNKSQNNIARKISKNLNCGFSTIGKHLIKLKYSKEITDLPLPVIIELVKIINIKLKNRITKTFKEFICKANNTKVRTNALKELDETLANLIGAHLADGHLSKGNNIIISDGKKDLIVECANWVKKTFYVKTSIRYAIRFTNKYWICQFGSKPIGRYFENIFNVKSGKKFDIAKEPKIIKKSSFKIRKAFAKGVLMFDGGIKSSGMVALSSMSRQLVDDIEEILKLDGIEINKRYNTKKKSWQIESKKSRNIRYLKKWLPYFEKGTWKYNRLNFFIEEKEYTIEELNYLFPKHHRSKIWLNDVYSSIKRMKIGKIKDVIDGLNKFKIAPVTVYKYLYLLEKSGLIYKELEKHVTARNGYTESIYYLK
tara:strand:- start:1029 stop:2141 length:1113 start_codon:yes stop_codon:yes gene_type:complete